MRRRRDVPEVRPLRKPPDKSCSLAFYGFRRTNELACRRRKSGGDAQQRRVCRVSFTALDSADEIPMQSARRSEPFLRKSAAASRLAHRFSECYVSRGH